jgi:hypothetical protein
VVNDTEVEDDYYAKPTASNKDTPLEKTIRGGGAITRASTKETGQEGDRGNGKN